MTKKAKLNKDYPKSEEEMKMTSNQMNQMKSLKLEDVIDVYSGVDGACCCGCKGKYSYAVAHMDLGTKRRGYPVDLSDCNNAMVRKVFNLFQAQSINEVDDLGDGQFSFVIGTRLYMIFFKLAVTA